MQFWNGDFLYSMISKNMMEINRNQPAATTHSPQPNTLLISSCHSNRTPVSVFVQNIFCYKLCVIHISLETVCCCVCRLFIVGANNSCVASFQINEIYYMPQAKLNLWSFCPNEMTSVLVWFFLFCRCSFFFNCKWTWNDGKLEVFKN